MAAAEKHFGKEKDLAGKIVLTAGIGGMGGAQPLAVKMANGVFLGCDVDEARIQKRLETKYLDEYYGEDFDKAIERSIEAKKNNEAVSIAVKANASEFFKYVLEKDLRPDLVTDQTSAHDPINGYVPDGMDLTNANNLREADSKKYESLSLETMRRHVEVMIQFQQQGSHVFDYGNNLREGARLAGLEMHSHFLALFPSVLYFAKGMDLFGGSP